MAFKTCTRCQQLWEDRDTFMTSSKIKLIGYQADFNQPTGGLFLFNHMEGGCGTTMAIRVAMFLDMYKGPIFTKSKMGSEVCSGNCLDIHNLDRCRAECRMEYIREIIFLILKANSETPETIKI
jgi:hypothetical protein